MADGKWSMADALADSATRTFGFACGYPTYDNRADFTGDCFTNVSDFNPLKLNFGQGGAPPIGPGVGLFGSR